MLLKRNPKKRNPYFVAAVSALVYFLVYSAVNLLWKKFDVLEQVLSATVFFLVFFFVQSCMNRRIEKKS